MVKVLKFYADWCGPCKVLEPKVMAVAEKTGVEVQHVNVDAEPEMAKKYGVRSIPYLVALKDDTLVATMVGSKSQSEVEEFFAKLT